MRRIGWTRETSERYVCGSCEIAIEKKKTRDGGGDESMIMHMKSDVDEWEGENAMKGADGQMGRCGAVGRKARGSFEFKDSASRLTR
jgi:hypothetical protein